VGNCPDAEFNHLPIRFIVNIEVGI